MSLLHDVMLTIGLFCLIGLEFNLQIIAAILTIVGYSLNDTVVVFDRIREYHAQIQADAARRLDRLLDQQRAAANAADFGDDALALIALYIFGGEVLRGFTLAMIWGVLIATYSSIFSLPRSWCCSASTATRSRSSRRGSQTATPANGT